MSPPSDRPSEARPLRRARSVRRDATDGAPDIVDRINAIVLRWDPEGRILFMNDFGQRLFGYTQRELRGRSVLELIVPEREASSGRDLVAMIRDLLAHPERYVSNENENVARDGTRLWITWRNTPIVDGRGRLVEILSTGVDTTDRKRAEDALRESEERHRELSVRDDLTGLYNRRYLYQGLAALIRASEAAGDPFSVLFADLDRFKRLVDSRGHLNGSRAIQEVAATIRSRLEEPAWAVAFAGDEFVVVLPGFARDAAVAKAREIQSCIRDTRYLAATGRPARLAASFGVASFPDDARDLEGLLALGDQALFSVKKSGRNGIAAAASELPLARGRERPR